MLPWIIVLAILGLILVFAEILIPGFGIFGIMGAVSLLASLILNYKLYGMMAFLILLVLLVIVFFAMIVFAKKSGLYNKVILKEKQDARDFDETALQGLLGQIGLTQSTLRPFGVADFGGKLVDVCSKSDFIDRGEKVQVVQITGKTVTVTAYKENKQGEEEQKEA